MTQEVTALGFKREGFVHRNRELFNLLPLQLKQETKIGTFKNGAKKWVKSNIKIKP